MAQTCRSACVLFTIVLGLAFSPLSPPLQADDGDLDATFGTANADPPGTVVTDLGTDSDAARAVAIQPDGYIVVAGAAGGNFGLARYRPDGALDRDFGGGDGRVVTDFAEGPDEAFGLAIQRDGRIVVVGSAMHGETFFDLALARYHPDGSLDDTFGEQGKVTTDVSTGLDVLHAVAIQPDGAIVVAGMAFVDNAGFDLVVARYLPDGSLDATFGSGGLVVTDAGGTADRANALALDADGRIVVAGVASTPDDESSDFAVARYTPDGTLDSGFGTGGLVITDIATGDDQANALAIQPDNAIVVAGAVTRKTGGVDFAIVRYLPDGAMDASFDTDGQLATDFAGDEDRANAVLIHEGGEILVAGLAFVDATTVHVALARYLPDGRPDESFGRSGRLTTGLARGAAATAVALQPDGHAVVAGYALGSAGSDFAAARYTYSPPRTITFYLHGQGTPGTATGNTMSGEPGDAEPLPRTVAGEAVWFSESAVTGTFRSGATFQVVLPCPLGLASRRTIRIDATDPDGNNERPLGIATQTVALCRASQAILIPVEAPSEMTNERLKLTITSSLGLGLRSGPSTFLQITHFAGTR